MAAIVRPYPAEGEEITDVPLSESGRMPRFQMFPDANLTVVYAETAEDLLDHLIGGYAGGSEQEKFEARCRFVLRLVPRLQATANADLDRAQVSDDEWATLNNGRSEPLRVAEWSSPALLFLADVDYAPFTDVPAPASGIDDTEDPSNLIWIRAADEYDLIVSLHRAGYITLREAIDTTP